MHSFTQVHEEYNAKLEDKLQTLGALKTSINNTFQFKEIESAEQKIDVVFSKIENIINQKLDEPYNKLKPDIKSITKSSRPIKNKAESIHLLSEKAKSSLDKKPSEYRLQHISNVIELADNVLHEHQLLDNSKKQIKTYARDLIMKTPKLAYLK